MERCSKLGKCGEVWEGVGIGAPLTFSCSLFYIVACSSTAS